MVFCFSFHYAGFCYYSSKQVPNLLDQEYFDGLQISTDRRTDELPQPSLVSCGLPAAPFQPQWYYRAAHSIPRLTSMTSILGVSFTLESFSGIVKEGVDLQRIPEQCHSKLRNMSRGFKRGVGMSRALYQIDVSPQAKFVCLSGVLSLCHGYFLFGLIFQCDELISYFAACWWSGLREKFSHRYASHCSRSAIPRNGTCAASNRG